MSCYMATPTISSSTLRCSSSQTQSSRQRSCVLSNGASRERTGCTLIMVCSTTSTEQSRAAATVSKDVRSPSFCSASIVREILDSRSMRFGGTRTVDCSISVCRIICRTHHTA